MKWFWNWPIVTRFWVCISQDACPPPASVASVGPSGTSIRSDVRLLLPCFVKCLTFDLLLHHWLKCHLIKGSCWVFSNNQCYASTPRTRLGVVLTPGSGHRSSSASAHLSESDCRPNQFRLGYSWTLMPVISIAAQLPVLRGGEQRDNRRTPPLAPKMVQVAKWAGLSATQPEWEDEETDGRRHCWI